MDKEKERVKKDIVDIYNKIDRYTDLFFGGTPDDECTKDVLINRIKLFKREAEELQAFVGKILFG